MSHTAVNWALEQTGLKPAAKLVLICLADRHNRDTGECFPSQARLAEDACISRSSLNMQLAELEALGLINRHPEIDPATKRQMRTNYTFNAPFAGGNPVSKIETRAVSKKAGEPCPKKAESRVQNLDTNLGREPKREPPSAQAREAEQEEGFSEDVSEGFLSDLRQAVGVDQAASGRWWESSAARSHVASWLAQGLTLPEILSAARKSREKHPTPPDGPKALDAAMRGAVAEKQAARKDAPAPIDDVLAFWADRLNSGAFVAPSSFKIATANALIQRGLVRPEALRSRGIAFTVAA